MNDDADFTVAWTVTSRRTLARLPEKTATAAVEFTDGSLAEDAWWVGKPLKLGLAGLHSARCGDYRVIYRMDESAHRHGHGHRAPFGRVPAAPALTLTGHAAAGNHGFASG